MPETTNYPGSRASAQKILFLATEYHSAALTLLLGARKGDSISRAPARLCAVHGIEFFLNAFLLNLGHSPRQIRARRHDLAERAELAIEEGLKLRKKTADHLARMSQDREYLVSRYGPELTSTLSEENRLVATLEEVGKKVKRALLDQDAAEVVA